jgi:hypothetical protein
MLEQDESIFFYLQSTFRDAQGVQEVHRGNISKWPYKSLKDVLSSFAHFPSTKPIYLILDAIDESEEGDRRDIIELLCNLCSEGDHCQIKVFLASRPVAELSGHIRKHHHLIKLQDENKDDISQFADDFLSKDLGLTGSDRGDARDYIVNNARGVFVWVALVKKELRTYIETGYRKGEVLEYLASLPQLLLGFYKLMLSRLERGTPRDIQDGQKIFRLVLFGSRPLTVAELDHALAVPDGRSLLCSYEEFGLREVRGIEKRILHCGGNFLEINCNSHQKVCHSRVITDYFSCSGWDGSVDSSNCSGVHDPNHPRCSEFEVRDDGRRCPRGNNYYFSSVSDALFFHMPDHARLFLNNRDLDLGRLSSIRQVSRRVAIAELHPEQFQLSPSLL